MLLCKSLQLFIIGLFFFNINGNVDGTIKEIIKFKQVEYEDLPSEFHDIKFFISYR